MRTSCTFRIALMIVAAASSAQAQKRSPAAKPAAPADEAAEIKKILVQARSNAEGIDDIPQKSTAMSLTAAAQLKLGDTSGALDTTARIPDSNVRARTYSQIAFEQAKSGDLRGAYATVELAKQGTSTGTLLALTDHEKEVAEATVLRGIASALAQRGDVEGVRRAAASVSLPTARGEFLLYVGKAQIKAGDLSGANQSFQDYALTIPDAGSVADRKLLAQSYLAKAQLESGDVPGALETARQISNLGLRTEVLSDFARGQTEKGDRAGAGKTIQEALEALQNFKDFSGFDKGNAANAVVVAQVQLGDLVAALDTARQIQNSYQKNQALNAVAVAQARAGKVQEAFQTANLIVDDLSARVREGTEHEILAAQAETGDIHGAVEGLEKLAKNFDASDVLSAIAAAQARAGDIKSALETLNKLPNTERRSWAFRNLAARNIASAQVQRGDLKGALEWIAKLNSPALESSARVGVAEGWLARRAASPAAR